MSGELTDDCAEELSALLASGGGERVSIELRDVTLVNLAAVKCLARAEVAGVALVSCPDYVRRWITAVKPGSGGEENR